ncbi:MAG: hypothetical protein LLF98_12900 [Clostridium sp.]|nr:hypothetical protein [Clostridium sp.]MCE5222111.1 hypothetical protein [Clostridium sp.]
MTLEKNDYYRDLRTVHDKCKNYLYYHIILTMTDGSKFDGIIDNVDIDNMTMLVGEDVMEKETENQPDQQRQYNGYNRPRRRFRRFRRETFPLASLAALSLLPYPYIAQPPYPYYPYYPYY